MSTARNVFVVLVLCAHPFLALGEGAPKPRKARRSHLTVTLTDGSKLHGRAGPIKTVLRTPYTAMKLEVADFKSIDLKGGPKNVACVFPVSTSLQG